MELVYCNCKNCNATVGLFLNLWTQIGKSYFSPIIDPDGELAITYSGAIRVGERGTLVAECKLQDIVCDSCAAILGLNCVETPVNHVLDENQILLRLASVDLLSRDGQEVEFSIKRVLDVREPSRVSSPASPQGIPHGAFNASSYHDAVDLLQLRVDIDGQRDDISRIDSNGSRIVSALDTRVALVEEQVSKLRDTLGLLRRDIGGVQEDLSSLKAEINNVKHQDTATLAGLEQTLASTNVVVEDVRQEVDALKDQLKEGLSGTKSELRQQKQLSEELRADLKGRIAVREHNKDITAMRTEIAHVKRQMDEMRSKAVERATAAPFPAKELDILTSNIAKIGNRASQVETLQMEFEILKGRVERAEASRQTDQLGTRSSNSDGFASYARKRTLSGTETSSGLDPMLKSPTFSPGYSNTPTRVYDGSSDVPTGSPPLASQNEDEASVRQTRAGKKRTKKR